MPQVVANCHILCNLHQKQARALAVGFSRLVMVPVAPEDHDVHHDFPPLSELSRCVADTSQPLGKRTHAAFYLRTLGGGDAVAALGTRTLYACTVRFFYSVDYCIAHRLHFGPHRAGRALRNRNDSALLRHELGYILGQMQDERACPVLEEVLADLSDDVMVRHEVSIAASAQAVHRFTTMRKSLLLLHVAARV